MFKKHFCNLSQLTTLTIAIICLLAGAAQATLPPEVYYSANVAFRGYSDDEQWGPFSIGFDFDFFGVTYTELYVTSNGWIGFNAPTLPGHSELGNTTLPTPSEPNNLIAAFWDDIVIHSNGGVIFYQTVGIAPNRKCVIQCTNMGFFGDPTLLGTFSFILYESTNEFQVQYRIIVDNASSLAHGSSATVGAENADGTVGVQYSFEEASLSSEQAIRFTPSGGSYTIDDNALFDGILLGDGLPPSIPQLLTPAQLSTVGLSPTFQWSPCDYTTSYEFNISTTSNLSGATVVSGITGTSYTPGSPLVSGTTYYWAVFAVGDDGTTWSEIRQCTVSDNPPPTANPQTVWTTLGADAVIILDGTGGHGDLIASVTTLPANGELYQYDNGARGGQISAAPTLVTDALRRVIYYVDDDTTGTSRGNFQFLVADTADWESDPATVTVNVYPAPTVVTVQPVSTGASVATSGGNVTADNGYSVTARGVCWATSINPTVASNYTSDDTGTGVYASSITGLTPGATYYVRAYAQNSEGIGYGSQYSFQAGLPVITTDSVTDITGTTASSGGHISADGGDAVSARGVCWATTINPTIADDYTSDGADTGVFVSSATGLEVGTDYYLRAYATNTVGTAYGENQTFSTLNVMYITGNVGIDSAFLVTSDTAIDTVWADTAGDYSITVPYDWSGIVTPVKTAYRFNPTERDYDSVETNLEDEDYFAQFIFLTIAGSVRNTSGIAVKGVPLDGLPSQPITTEDGFYSTMVPYGWSGSATPKKTDYTFSPEIIEFDSVITDQTNQDFTAYYLSLGVDGENDNQVPTEFSLGQNWPNPFNPATTIRFGLPKSTYVTLRVYNILGGEVVTLIAKDLPAGNYQIDWNGADANGREVATGLYLYRLQADTYTETRKMLLLK